jgi:hypothetical protein
MKSKMLLVTLILGFLAPLAGQTNVVSSQIDEGKQIQKDALTDYISILRTSSELHKAIEGITVSNLKDIESETKMLEEAINTDAGASIQISSGYVASLTKMNRDIESFQAICNKLIKADFQITRESNLQASSLNLPSIIDLQDAFKQYIFTVAKLIKPPDLYDSDLKTSLIPGKRQIQAEVDYLLNLKKGECVAYLKLMHSLSAMPLDALALTEDKKNSIKDIFKIIFDSYESKNPTSVLVTPLPSDAKNSLDNSK